MLIDMWDTILTDLDRGSAASCGISLDFEKTFNRLNHDSCMEALKAHGASTSSLRVIHSFLEGRSMTARVGTALSTPRPVRVGGGGALKDLS